MRVFVAVAEARGFAPAARRLSISPPAVTRAVAALEARLGAQLLHRTTRVVRLTEAGARFLADCKRILADLEDAEAAAAGSHVEPRGNLTITASTMFGHRYVAPIVLDFLARYPLVTARTIFVDRVVNLVDEGVDVAVRIGRLRDSTLTAVRIGSVRRVICASPEYLAARGVPRTLEELGEHDAIAFAFATSDARAKYRAQGLAKRATPRIRLVVNTAEVAIAAALAGHGFISVPSYMIASELAAGRLRVVLEDVEPPPVPVHLVHPHGRRAAARVRTFVDFAVERLRSLGSFELLPHRGHEGGTERRPPGALPASNPAGKRSLDRGSRPTVAGRRPFA